VAENYKDTQGRPIYDFPFFLSKPSTGEVEIKVKLEGVRVGPSAPAAGMFEGPGFDYMSPQANCIQFDTYDSCTVVFPPSCTGTTCETPPIQTTLPITILDDLVTEALKEELKVTIESVVRPLSVSVSPTHGSASLFILNDDETVVSLTPVADVEKEQGPMIFQVKLSNAVDRNLDLSYRTVSPSAVDIATGNFPGHAYGAADSAPIDIGSKTIYPDFLSVDSGTKVVDFLMKESVIQVQIFDNPQAECDETFKMEIDGDRKSNV